jgi:hypothetical protein
LQNTGNPRYHCILILHWNTQFLCTVHEVVSEGCQDLAKNYRGNFLAFDDDFRCHRSSGNTCFCFTHTPEIATTARAEFIVWHWAPTSRHSERYPNPPLQDLYDLTDVGDVTGYFRRCILLGQLGIRRPYFLLTRIETRTLLHTRCSISKFVSFVV